MRAAARLIALGAAALAIAGVPATAWAHGVAVRGDLPVPASIASLGAGVVLVASFAALAALWPEPRLARLASGRALPAVLSRISGGLVWPARALGIAVFTAVVAAAVTGPPSPTENFAAVAVYIGLWVGVLLASAVLGDVWHALSPFETAAAVGRALTRRDGGAPVDAGAAVAAHAPVDAPVARLGVWPAVVLLAGFVWLELVYPNPAAPGVLLAAITVYVAIIATGAIWHGAAWLRSAEAFGALFRLVAAMAPVCRDASGWLRVRWPLAGLTRLPGATGVTALILLALGSTTFDGVSRQPFWEDLVGMRTGWATVPYDTLGLVVTVAVVAGIYLAAMREGARVTGWRIGDLANAFAHSLVPIALAYAIAHYFSLLVFEGQRLLALASDPADLGWNLFGTADWTLDLTLVSTTTIAWVQVGAIVVGHLAGVVLAHDRAVELFPVRTATRSQFPLLVAMVAYTMGGLVLMLGGG